MSNITHVKKPGSFSQHEIGIVGLFAGIIEVCTSYFGINGVGPLAVTVYGVLSSIFRRKNE